MKLETKINFLAAVIIVLVISLGLFLVYRRLHPKYVPVPRPETELTIIPGWNLRQVAEYLVEKGFATSTEAVYRVAGKPAHVYSNSEVAPPYPITAKAHPPTTSSEKITWLEMWKPERLSYEGYLAPETYRVFKDATLVEIIAKMVKQRDKELPVEMAGNAQVAILEDFYDDTGLLDHPNEINQVLTMASIIEKEVKFDDDRAKVADILWRRVKRGWALQVDSSVHYAVDKTGTVYTTDQERQVDSLWNTYKYNGLPPGPISNPSLESIKAALYPGKNEYWYFLTGKDGTAYYAKTLEEHNENKLKAY